MTSHSELMQLYRVNLMRMCSVCVSVSVCVCVSVTAYLGVQSMHQCVLRVSVGGRAASVSCHGHVRRGAACVTEVGLCRREYIWSVQKENYTFIQYNTCRVELTAHREKSSTETWVLLSDRSVFSADGNSDATTQRAVQPGRHEPWFSVYYPPPPQKKKKQQQKNNTKTTGVGRIVELYSRLINPTNHFPAASFRLEVASASSSRLLPRTSGDSSVDRHLLAQRRLRSSTSLKFLPASATTPVSPA